MNTKQNDEHCDKIEYLIETIPSSGFHDVNCNSNDENDKECNVTDCQRGNESNEIETSGASGRSDPNQAKEMKSVMKTNKAFSYQDIHSEYTKRRYRNVESKVAQYIANIRAQDKKRQNSRKSFSHDTLIQHQHQQQQQNNDLVYENRDDDQVMSPIYTSFMGIECCVNTNSIDTAYNSHETGIDGVIYIEKHIYEQLLKCKDNYDYLEDRLEEKQAENFRLKQNLDLIRIKLSQCEDKLKEKTQLSSDYRSVNNLNSVGWLSKYATQTFKYPTEKLHKITQTEITLTPSPLPRQPSPLQADPCTATNMNIISMPMTPDLQNPSMELNMLGMQAPIKVSKTMTAIQPLALNFSTMERKYEQPDDQSNITLKFLRQRSNSLAKRKKFPHSVQLSNTNNDDCIIVESSSTPAKQENQVATTITISPIIINPMSRNRSKRIKSHIKKLFTLCTKCHEISYTCDNNNNSNNNLLNSPTTTSNTTSHEVNTYTRTQ